MAAQRLHFVLLLCSILNQADGIASNMTIKSRGAQAERGYTQNSLCRENNCVNPIFPGLNDLPRLETLTWQCSSNKLLNPYMDFCKDAVLYDPAVPSPKKTLSAAEIVKAQDDAAMTMFVYHLSGMGYDAWDYREPSLSDNDCVRSVWKMVCFTYFPRANAGCQAGETSLYQRPCGSSAKNYLSTCGVECCDESVQVSFSHTKTNTDGKVEVLQTGYVNADGPSATCTGASRRSVTAPLFLLLAIFGFHFAAGASGEIVESAPAAALASKACSRSRLSRQLPLLFLVAALSLGLQGCMVSHHTVGNWEAQPSYLSEYSFLPAGAKPNAAILNSCAVKNVLPSQQCSGRGYCESFTTSGIIAAERDQSLLAFCRCDEGWADPECTTARKSQTTAFFLSVCFGPLGADYFYLGYPLLGVGKLATLGGLGAWWMTDIVRIASGPVYSQKYRVANDLSHWVAILILVFLCMLLGFFAAIESYLSQRRQKRLDLQILQQSEEQQSYQDTVKSMRKGYGAAAQAPYTGIGGEAVLYAAGPQDGSMSPMMQFAGRSPGQ